MSVLPFDTYGLCVFQDSATGKNHWAWGNMTFILEEAESLEDYDKTIGMLSCLLDYPK